MPRLATVIGSLNNLPEPAAGLRRIESVRLNRRAFEMVHFPACEMRPAHVPLFARAIRRQDEAPFFVPTNTRILLMPHSFRR